VTADRYLFQGPFCLSASGGDGGGGGGGSGATCVGDVCGTVTQVGSSDAGTTYQLGVTLSGSAANVYTIYGSSSAIMSIPAASQVDAPFGANTGGVSPALIAVNAAAAFDSWLTVGITDGDSAGALGSVGIDWATWATGSGVEVDNGAVFLMDPSTGPAGGVLAQLTVSGDFTAVINCQGQSTSGDDWQAEGITFSGSSSGGGGDTVCSDDDGAATEVAAGLGVVVTTCGELAGYCSDADYGATMGDLCPVTCGTCGGGGDTGGTNCVGDVCGTVTEVGSSDAGTTYQIGVTLSGSAANVYTIYGTDASPLSVPASYQEAAPFGSNTGGVSPGFVAVIATAAYDGWLTVGITDGDTAGALGSVGLDWTMWTDNAALESANGAVFFMSPDDGPAGEAVVAQFTTAPGWSASLGAQGRSSSGDDWQADGLTFSA